MNFTDHRYLSAGNIYSSQPALLAILHIAPQDLPAEADLDALRDQVVAMLGNLRHLHGLLGLRGNLVHLPAAGLELARLVLATALELQCLAGSEPSVAFVGGLPHMPDRYRLVMPGRPEQAASTALALAVQLIDAVGTGQPFDVPRAVQALRLATDRRSGNAPYLPPDACRRGATATRRDCAPVRAKAKNPGRPGFVQSGYSQRS